MQIGLLGLLIIGVVYKLEPALDVGGPLHLRGPAFEICIPKDLPARPSSAKGS